MLKNYFKIAFRILWRNKFYSLINIIGLAIGLCSSIIVFLYVQHEFSYDKFHKDSERIFRFIMQEGYKGSAIEHPGCRLPVGPALKNDFPEIENVVRIRKSNIDITHENSVFSTDNLFYVDTGFFKMFAFPLINGKSDFLLQETNAIILSNSFAKKIFGDIDPIGKTLSSLYVHEGSFIVRGIAADPPSNTKFKFDLIAPAAKMIGDGRRFGWTGGSEFETFVKIKENVEPKKLNSKFLSFFEKHISGSNKDGYLQPLKDMYFHSSQFSYADNTQHFSEVLLFAMISIFILFIAIINYINLSTARSVKRSKEVGIKKVVGASRTALIRQFFAESYLIMLISILFALILIEIFLPSINNFFNYKLSLYNLEYQNIILILFLFFVGVGSLSAFYPALFLSSFKPIIVLKGGLSAKRKSHFRTGLVVFQFIVSSILISCTLYSVQQLNYIKNKKPGYNRNNLLVVRLTGKVLKQKQKIVKNEILLLPGVIRVAASSQYPGQGLNGGMYKTKGMVNALQIRLLEVDADYIKTMGMNIIKGRDFSRELITDKKKYIINKTFANWLNWDETTNNIIKTYCGKSSVIGVIDDFHFASLQSKIEPLVLINDNYFGYNYLNIKLDGNTNAEITIKAIEKIIKDTDQSRPFLYTFVDDKYGQSYNSEIKFSKLFQLFSFLAIFIACLGLFGLAAFSAEQRTKEIGIRKVMGATQKQLLSLISKQYFLIIIVANTIAIPITLYLLQSWQNNYAYHVDITVILFIVTFLINSIIAAIIIYMQTAKATNQNPIESLKYE